MRPNAASWQSIWQTLVPEIISTIFEYLVDGVPLFVVKPYRFPWNLGHICSAWRDVFTSCPKFWSTLVIDFGSGVGVPLDRFYTAQSLVNLCLERSREHLICFRFVQELDHLQFKDEKSTASHDILQTLMEHSTRWRLAHFHMHMHNFSSLATVKNRLPTLRSLEFSTGVSPEEVEVFVEILEDAPQLQRVLVHDYGFRTFNPTDPIPLTRIGQSLAINLFSRLARVEELCIDSGVSPTIDGNDTPLTFPLLKKLGVKKIRYLQLLNTPALEELYLKSGVEGIAPGDPEIGTLLLRFAQQKMNLKKLFIHSNHDGWTRILLQNTPRTLESLVLVLDLPYDLNLLPLCSSARRLTSVTIQMNFNDGYLCKMAEIIESWVPRDSDGKGGSWPFENLQCFVLQAVDGGSFQSDTVERLVIAFADRGVRCRVEHARRDIHWEFHYGMGLDR